MSIEEPTQRIDIRPQSERYAADAPTTALPGPLSLADSDPRASGPEPQSDPTDVLSLDELFAAEPGNDADAEAAPVRAPSAAEAPTWTAMPVVPVRSEPVRPGAAAVPPVSAAADRPALGDRIRTDASAAWDGTVRRTRAWLGRDDNALTLLTALVAVLLIIAVAALSR